MSVDTHNTYQFPDIIRHESGVDLKQDLARLLLAFKTPHSLSEVKGMTSSSEDLFDGIQFEQDDAYLKTAQRINNTQNHYWVLSRDQEDIAIDKIEALTEGLSDLGWVGPVYKFSKSENPEYRLCVLPDTLLIRPAERYKSQGDLLDELLKDYGLVHVSELTKLLVGFRYYTFIPSRARKSIGASVYKVQKLLTTAEEFKNVVLTAVFDYMPMLVPQVSQPNIRRTEPETISADIPDEKWAITSGWRMPSVMDSIRELYSQIFPPRVSINVPTQEIVAAAVIDQSGVQLDHPAFNPNPPPSPNAFVSGATFYPDVGFNQTTGIGPVYIDNTSSSAGGVLTSDSDPHGTLCTGIIAARYNSADPAPNGWRGMAPEDMIMPLKVIGFKKSLVAAAISMAAQGSAVISISDSDASLDGADPMSNPVAAAIEDAVNTHGVVICASSANYNQNTFHYPASHPLVLACGACNQSGNRCTPADWGNNRGSNYGAALSVVAPGVNITSTDLTDSSAGQRGLAIGDYVQNFWGTSAAAPQVAALAVLIIHNFPAFYRNYSVIRFIIEYTADRVGHVTVTVDALGNPILNSMGVPVKVSDPLWYQSTGKPSGTWNWEMGYGRINVANALALAKAMSSSYAAQPPPPAPTGLKVS